MGKSRQGRQATNYARVYYEGWVIGSRKNARMMMNGKDEKNKVKSYQNFWKEYLKIVPRFLQESFQIL